GGLIYYVRNGVPCARTTPKPSTKPPTPAQLAQRMRMKLTMRFLAPLAPVLEETFKPGNRQVKSGLNWATKQVLQDAVAGDYPHLYIDPRRVMVSWGGQLALQQPVLAVGSDGLCSLQWLNGDNPFVDGNAPAFLLAYNETQGRVVVSDGTACRGEGQLSLQLAPRLMQGRLHGYCFVMDRRRREASRSVFLGTWVDGERQDGALPGVDGDTAPSASDTLEGERL
uniref:DUF6266 family protein n=1 Tax=Parapedobacter soli TaxID=416955 RepID=UPI0021CA1845